MRIVTAIALLLSLALAPAGLGRADQNDPRLDELFARLKAASDPQAARDIEMNIWHIWIVSDDEVVGTLMAQGMAAMARRDYRAALGKFDQMVTIAPDFAEGWNKRATVHYLLGNYERSLHDIDRTLALEPRHFGALSGRGLVYVALKKDELALESFEAALEIHPLLPGAGYNAEALRRRLGNREI
ncbi:MAG: tetratricopeptide repeat protein [Kiloniellaceae bacterium]